MKKQKLKKMKRQLPLYLMALPGILYLLINNYLPMTGLVVAFKEFNYRDGIWGSPWNGVNNFKYLFSTSTSLIITRNTLLYNLAFIVLNTLVALTIAILLNEIRKGIHIKFFQTVILLPYLLSIIIVGYLVYAFLGNDLGFVNTQILTKLGMNTIEWYSQPKYWPFILLFVNTLKNFGFLAIIYYASVISIGKDYYEAAELDGAGKMKQIWYITLPFLKPTIIMMVLLAVGKVFYSDFGLFYQVPQNSGALFSVTNTIDTYVYRSLIQLGDVGMASAAGVYQSIVGFILVFLTNLLVRKMRKQKERNSIVIIVAYVVLGIISFMCIAPVVLMAVASFTDNDVLNLYGYTYFPQKWSLEAYEFLIKQGTVISKSFLNSILVTFMGTALGIMVTVLLAYTISRKELVGRKLIMLFVFFTMLFNGGMVPTYLMYTQIFHIKNTMWALLFPHLLVNGFNVLLVRTFFNENIPEVLLEAARIDGAGEISIFRNVVLPISKPILATIGLLVGVGYWNDWYNGLLFVTDVNYYTLQNFLNKIMTDLQFLSQNMSATSDVNSIIANVPSGTVRMAMAFIGALPVIIVFPFFQKYFTKGITVGAVKE